MFQPELASRFEPCPDRAIDTHLELRAQLERRERGYELSFDRGASSTVTESRDRPVNRSAERRPLKVLSFSHRVEKVWSQERRALARAV